MQIKIRRGFDFKLENMASSNFHQFIISASSIQSTICQFYWFILEHVFILFNPPMISISFNFIKLNYAPKLYIFLPILTTKLRWLINNLTKNIERINIICN